MFDSTKPTLYLVRGVSGAGKSTFAEALATAYGGVHIEADMYFMQDGTYNFQPYRLTNAHNWCMGVAHSALMAGRTVVVSNTSTTEREVQTYQDLAKSLDTNFVSLIVENRNGTMSVHDVPEEVLQRQRSRFSVKL